MKYVLSIYMRYIYVQSCAMFHIRINMNIN